MTATEFRQTHPNPATWTTADHEAYDVLRTNDQYLNETAKASTDRPRTLLAPAA